MHTYRHACLEHNFIEFVGNCTNENLLVEMDICHVTCQY